MRMDSWHAHSQTWIRLPKHARPVHRLCIDSALSMHIDRLKTSPDGHLAPCSRPGGPGRGGDQSGAGPRCTVVTSAIT